jgi:histone H3/H4
MALREFYSWIIISYNMEDEIIKAAMEILQPVLESAMILAGHYTKACGRSTMTSLDVKYSMRYAARNLVGKHVGSLFPEDDEDEESEDEEEIETVDEDDEPFTRYSGEESLMNDINYAHDTWETWIPTSPVERMLKDSIDNTY